MELVHLVARNGAATAKVVNGSREVFLHSKYDPQKEAAKFIGQYDLQPGDELVIYGAGLGYHVREALARIGSEGRIYLFQFGTLIYKELQNMGGTIEDSRVLVYAEDDISKLAGVLSQVLADLMPEKGKVIIHKPSLELLPDSVQDFRAALEDWQVRYATHQRFSPLLEENLQSNIDACKKMVGVEWFFDRFEQVPAVLVAGGPSLDREMAQLRRFGNENKGLIICVGTVLKALVSAGVRPHFVVITDPQVINTYQVQSLDSEVPLILFPTVHPKVIEAYKGPKILALTDDEETLQLFGKKKEAIIKAGGSVATAMLDIAIKYGCNPIVFVGQDLAYPQGRSHASNTLLGNRRWGNRELSRFSRRVKDNFGRLVPTSKVFDIYRKWIEERIQQEDGREFFNTSMEGACIAGTRVISLNSLVENLPSRTEEFQDIISDLLGKGSI